MSPELLFTKIAGLIGLTALLTFSSCKKDNSTPPPVVIPEPAMEYTNLEGKVVTPNAAGVIIDFNKDGKEDMLLYTRLVGDAINKQDKLQFLAMSSVYSKLPVSSSEEIPVMSKSALIPLNDFSGYSWYNGPEILLVQKVIGINVPAYWEGHWKNAVNKYLPVQVIKGYKRYNGWVELSVDITGEKIILHKAAISKEAEKEIKAGL
jgi:hypothetical protein